MPWLIWMLGLKKKGCKLSAQIIAFISVGVISTAITIVVLVSLVEFLSMNLILSSVLGYSSGAFINYVLNYRITFASTKRHYKTAPKFLLVILVGMFFNTIIMYLVVNIFTLPYVLGQIVAIGLVVTLSYLSLRYWAFTDRPI